MQQLKLLQTLVPAQDTVLQPEAAPEMREKLQAAAQRVRVQAQATLLARGLAARAVLVKVAALQARARVATRVVGPALA